MINCWLDYQSDFRRFWRYSQMGKGENTLAAEMVATAHMIERGLSLPDPRPGYGKEKIESLLELIEKCDPAKNEQSKMAYSNAVAVLRSYCDYHREISYDLRELGEKIEKVIPAETEIAGYVKFTLAEYLEMAKGDFRSCAQSRYSVRAYGKDPVPEKMLLDALEVARKTPSVCNRQSWKLYWVKSEEGKKILLGLQKGHRGFGHQTDSFLIVATDLSTFIHPGERNQAFVDGGLYAMSLLLSLHYVGLGACTLNWCVSRKIDRKLKMELNIPPNENVIVIIAVGTLPKEVRVAKSIRKSVYDTLERR